MPTEREPYFASGVWDTPEESGAVPPPEAEDYDLPTCDRCGTPNDEWDKYCTCCGYPVGLYARLKEAGELEAYLYRHTPVTEDTPF